MNSYQAGNTVRVDCTFLDFNGVPVNPDVVKLIVYDYKYTVLDTIIITEQYKVSTGQYYYDYVTTVGEQLHYYEWYGEINGLPSLKRGQFRTSFI